MHPPFCTHGTAARPPARPPAAGYGHQAPNPDCKLLQAGIMVHVRGRAPGGESRQRPHGVGGSSCSSDMPYACTLECREGLGTPRCWCCTKPAPRCSHVPSTPVAAAARRCKSAVAPTCNLLSAQHPEQRRGAAAAAAGADQPAVPGHPAGPRVRPHQQLVGAVRHHPIQVRARARARVCVCVCTQAPSHARMRWGGGTSVHA